jgi:hypothetical protein
MTKPSNFNLDITSELDQLELTLALGFGDHKARAFRVDVSKENVPRLHLLWHNNPESSEKTQSLFVQLGPTEILPMVRAWLGEVTYPSCPNFDGSCYKGFRAHTGGTLKEPYDFYRILIVEPEWAMYHK